MVAGGGLSGRRRRTNSVSNALICGRTKIGIRGCTANAPTDTTEKKMGAAKQRKAEIELMKQNTKPAQMGRTEIRAKVASAMYEVLGEAIGKALQPSPKK